MDEDTPTKGEPQAQPGDETKQLYLARIEKALGKITLGDGSTHDLSLNGEILIAGQPSHDKTLAIEEIRIVSLWSDSLEGLGGIIAFAGPANKIAFEPGPSGVAEPFDVHLSYPKLNDLEPACADSDAIFPQLETLQGQFAWEPADPIDQDTLRAQVTFILDKLTEPQLGAVQAIVFEPALLTFEPVREQKIRPTKANSLGDCTTCGITAPSGSGTVIRTLQVRFVSLVVPIPAGLETTVQELICGAGKVWWTKGGLNIVPQSAIDPAATAMNGPISAAQELSVPGTAGNDPYRLDIYLAAELSGGPGVNDSRDGGGITRNCRTSSAFTILDVKKAANNRYLLAHELGHVLGLRHPGTAAGQGGCAGTTPGSFCSVMVADSPNSSRNTGTNLAAIQGSAVPVPPATVPPLGPLISSSTMGCGLHPDTDPGGFHYISDSPYDRGQVPSAPEMPFTNWWSSSDIWNSHLAPLTSDPEETKYSDNSDMFAPNHAPVHTSPSRIVSAAGTNHMYVRLHSCEPLNPANDVSVYLFLAAPGASATPLTLVPATSSANPNPLIFTSAPPGAGSPPPTLPTPGFPKTLHLQWNVPTGLPVHSCAFAVARSSEEALPAAVQAVITNPSAYTFASLAPFVVPLNDVAQRNLHIPLITPPPPSPHLKPFWTLLAWLEISNPFKQAASARLVIDTTQAARLADLVVEVNDTVAAKVAIGQATTVELNDALRPGDHMIFRLRANIPPDVLPGTLFPIDIRFYIGEEYISGYQYMLRVAPLAETVAQVLDTLFGALWDVAAGFGLDDATEVAHQVARIIAEVADRPEQALDSLSKLADRVAAVGMRIDPNLSPQHKVVRQRLMMLAGTLLTRSSGSLSSQFVEQVREHADHIQQPSGLLARAQ